MKFHSSTGNWLGLGLTITLDGITAVRNLWTEFWSWILDFLFRWRVGSLGIKSAGPRSDHTPPRHPAERCTCLAGWGIKKLIRGSKKNMPRGSKKYYEVQKKLFTWIETLSCGRGAKIASLTGSKKNIRAGTQARSVFAVMFQSQGWSSWRSRVSCMHFGAAPPPQTHRWRPWWWSLFWTCCCCCCRCRCRCRCRCCCCCCSWLLWILWISSLTPLSSSPTPSKSVDFIPPFQSKTAMLSLVSRQKISLSGLRPHALKQCCGTKHKGVYWPVLKSKRQNSLSKARVLLLLFYGVFLKNNNKNINHGFCFCGSHILSTLPTPPAEWSWSKVGW